MTEYEHLVEQERVILSAQEAIIRRMQDRAMTKADLARLMGTSRAHVTQVLSGTRNMTLRTLAEIAQCLDCTLEISGTITLMHGNASRGIVSIRTPGRVPWLTTNGQPSAWAWQGRA